MARSAWYNVPRILTKFMDVNVIHKNAKVWCQIHPDIKDHKRQSFLHSSFTPRLSTCLSCILNSWCQERIWYWSSGILKHCIVILYGTFTTMTWSPLDTKCLFLAFSWDWMVFYFWHKTCICHCKELKENDFSSAYVWDLSGNVHYILGLAPFKSTPMWLKY